MSKILQTFLILLVISGIFTMIPSCTHEPLIFSELPTDPGGSSGGGGGGGGGSIDGIPCNPDTSYFVNDVLPILLSNCAMEGCHDAGTAEEGIILSTYNQVMASDVVKPGNPWDSDLIEAINETDLDDRMPPPPAAPLTAAQKAILVKWIAQGALNNSCGEECDTTTVTYSGTISGILTAYCTGCHGGTSPSGGISLTNYVSVAAAAADGSLYGSVNHDAGFAAMPLGSDKLSDCKVDQIRIWIESGYENN
ncbi:MAG: c-type cytochrome domain-containing protein [Chitinophagales bacterium]